MAQSFFNANLANIVATRETFEERLRSMSGLEYIVSEAPEETGPGMGTGVWVIKKQTRKKRNGQEDELTVHALYYIIGQNIYPAPSLMDTMSSKMVSGTFTTMSELIRIPNTHYVSGIHLQRDRKPI